MSLNPFLETDHPKYQFETGGGINFKGSLLST